MPRILIIDDDKMLCQMLTRKLTKMSHEVLMAHTAGDGLATVDAFGPEVIFLDVMLPDGDGLQLIPRLKQAYSSPEVIIFTARATLNGAELAIKSGAWDYIAKPSSLQNMILPLTRALEFRAQSMKKHRTYALDRDDIIGRSPQMKQCFNQVADAAQSETSVLITGESGTGKELFASAIHRNSARRKKRFVVVDCTVLPQNLVASILFGHEKGAFTGATERRAGLVALADGGTLFLDEVGELPLETQKVFLRVLQERHFLPVGASERLSSNFRLVAATNRDLGQMTEKGLFRQDLLYRIRAVSINLPPLRNRKSDLAELITHFLRQASFQSQHAQKTVSPEFLRCLEAYGWPGNVRELHAVLEHAISTSGPRNFLFPPDLPNHVRISLAQAKIPKAGVDFDIVSQRLAMPADLPTFRDMREQMEQSYLKDLISVTHGDIHAACSMSALSRSRLYTLLKKYDLSLKSD